MLLRGALVGLLVFSLLAAGCLGPRDRAELPEEEGPVIPEPAQRVHGIRSQFVEEVRGDSPAITGAWVYPIETQITGDFVVEVPNGTRTLEVSMLWYRTDHDLILVVSGPDGEERYTTGDLPVVDETTSVNASYEDPSPGTWTIYGAVEGVLRGADTVMVTAWHEYLEHPDLPLIPVTQDEDGAWTALYGETRRGIPLLDELVIDLATMGGTVLVETHEDPETFLEVRPWARAADEERARSLAASVQTDLELTAGTTHAYAQAPQDLAEDEAAGAHLILKVGRPIVGSISTTGGGVIGTNLTSVQALAVAADGGSVTGDFRPSGALTIATQDGDVEVEIRAVRDTHLAVAAMNGAVHLGLEENDQVGYELEANSSGGRVDSTMEEATLAGSTLTTSDFEQRVRQVSGAVTASKDITFAPV